MNTAALITRILERLEGNDVLYPPAEVARYGLNPALLLIALLKPELSMARTLLTLPAQSSFHDLRVEAPRLLRLYRVALGDHRTDTPVASAGHLEDLRRSHLGALHSRRAWLLTTRHAPTHYLRWGAFWLITFPRAVVEHTATLMYCQRPARLYAEEPDGIPTIPEAFHDVLADVGAGLLQMKMGSQETQAGLQAITTALGKEPFAAMEQTVGRAARRVMVGQGTTT